MPEYARFLWVRDMKPTGEMITTQLTPEMHICLSRKGQSQFQMPNRGSKLQMKWTESSNSLRTLKHQCQLNENIFFIHYVLLLLSETERTDLE